MRKNILEEPGANEDQLFELAINLKNARTFAGKGNGDDDWDWREGDWTDPDDDDLYDWEPKPKRKAQGTYGKFAQQLANGGRVGLEEGTKPITLGSLIIDFIVANNRQPKPSEVLQLKEKLKPSSK